MNLILDYESSALAAPQSFLNAMQTAVNILDSTILNNITVTIEVGYNDFFNNEITGLGASAEGGDLSGAYVSYSSLRASLASNETSPLDQTFVNSLPNTSSVNGVSSLYVPSAIEKALGMISPTAPGIDGAIGIGSGVPTADLVGVALHELTHAMGREPGAGTFDLGRYTSPGTHLFASGSTAPPSYFSIDGGVTKLADYGQNSDPSDMLNSGVQGPNDPFNEFYSGSTIQGLTTIDKQQLDALGFNVTPSATGTPSAMTSSLVTSSPTVTADGISTTTLTVTVEDANGNAVAGTAVTLSGSGSANSFGAISGTTDANGVFTTTLASTLVQNETITATEGSAQEHTSVSFVAGASVIQIDGSTSLTEVGTNFYLLANGTGPELKAGGAAVTVGEWGQWAPIGAVQVAGGYDVAWKDPGSGQYQVWSVDSSGNLISNNLLGTTSAPGSSTALESLETTFHQDLNGDGVIGLPTTVIQTDGSTSLTEVGTNFYLFANGTGPELQAGGAAVTVGEWGQWAPIGAVQVAGGYNVAWKDPGSGQYQVWSVDSSGNLISNNLLGTTSAPGSSTALESLETTFHQDLNGDGVIGIPTNPDRWLDQPDGGGDQLLSVRQWDRARTESRRRRCIPTNSTSLTEVGTNFYLFANGTGPELKAGGAAVTVGEWGQWAPIGAVQVAGGYDVAWKDPGSGQYQVWSVDSSGNLISNNLLGTTSAPGSSTALESLETTFHQDLNGDGVIGIPPVATSPVATNQAATAPAAGSATVNTAAAGSGGSFVFDPNFGHVTISNSTVPAGIDFSHTVFANINALLAAAQDDGHGNVIITDASHDTLTIQKMTAQQLHAQQSDFHII